MFIMDESQYQQLVEEAFRRVLDAFEDVDPDLAEPEPTGDVLTITFGDGSQCVMNTQRPTRQIWLAGRRQAWHFSYDADSNQWLDDKDQQELCETLRDIVKKSAGVSLTL